MKKIEDLELLTELHAQVGGSDLEVQTVTKLNDALVEEQEALIKELAEQRIRADEAFAEGQHLGRRRIGHCSSKRKHVQELLEEREQLRAQLRAHTPHADATSGASGK